MNLLRDIVSELLSMFLADAKMSGAILFLVATVAYLVDVIEFFAPLIGGVALLAGCLSILVGVTAIEARHRQNTK